MKARSVVRPSAELRALETKKALFDVKAKFAGVDLLASEQPQWILTAAAFVVRYKYGYNITANVTPSPGSQKWLALGLVSPGQGFQAVLDHHAHQPLGEFSSLLKAMICAEKFVRTWKPDGKVCPCPDLASASAPSKRPRPHRLLKKARS